MSSISITFNPKDKSFRFENSDLLPHYCDLVAGIELENETLDLFLFSYGYDLILPSGEIYKSKVFGAEVGVIFESTDQPVLEVDRVFWEEGLDLTLRAWFRNFGQTYEGFYEFSTPVNESSAPVDEL